MKPFRLKWCCRDLMVFSSDSLGSINVAPEKRGGTRLWEEWADADMAFWPTKCINFSFPPALCPYFWLGPCYSLFVLENCGWTHSIRFIFWGVCTAVALLGIQKAHKSTALNAQSPQTYYIHGREYSAIRKVLFLFSCVKEQHQLRGFLFDC